MYIYSKNEQSIYMEVEKMKKIFVKSNKKINIKLNHDNIICLTGKPGRRAVIRSIL